MGKITAIREVSVSLADEVPGLRQAFAIEDAALAKLESIMGRVAAAKASVILRMTDRNALVSRAAAGDEVSPAELRRTDEAIRDAEAAVTLAEAAIPAVKRDAEQASHAVSHITRDLWSEAREQLKREYADAEQAMTAAKRALDAAHGRMTFGLPVHNGLPSDVWSKVNGLIDAHRD